MIFIIIMKIKNMEIIGYEKINRVSDWLYCYCIDDTHFGAIETAADLTRHYEGSDLVSIGTFDGKGYV